MPYVRVRLKSLKPQANPRTFGDHLRVGRQALGLRQKEAAALLGVGPETILHWEKGQTAPPDRAWPAILAFLGYDPHPKPRTLPERLRALRRSNGWSIKQAARASGVDERTWAGWECGRKVALCHARLLGQQLQE